MLEQTNPWLSHGPLEVVSASLLLPGSGNVTFISLSFRFCIFKMGLMLRGTHYWVFLNNLCRWNPWVKDGNYCKQQECFWREPIGVFWLVGFGGFCLFVFCSFSLFGFCCCFGGGFFWFFFVRNFFCRGPNTTLPASIPPPLDKVHLPGEKGLCCPRVTAQHPDWKPLQPEMS